MANIFQKWFGKKEEKVEEKGENLQSALAKGNADSSLIKGAEVDELFVEEELIEQVDEKLPEVEEKVEFVEKPKGFFSKLKEGLSKTRNGLNEKVNGILANFRKIDEDFFGELEEILFLSDIGVQTSQKIIEGLKSKVKLRNISNPEDIKALLKEELMEIMRDSKSGLELNTKPSVIIMVGVNGVGKTTSIGKISAKLKASGRSVLMAAGDTFRAAAIDQLDIWGKRVGVDVIKHQEGADPGAVIFDAAQAAKSRKIDVLICDTAGRLHNKKNLMDELGKVDRILGRELPESSKEVLLVLDATTGQNAVQQAKTFSEVTNVTGIVLTKLDGTAKGGIVVTIKSELEIPVKFIGVGEGINDLQEFNPEDFVNALFD